jgi:exopolysaccharide biosynthesis protein
MTLKQTAEWMKALGCHRAMNLDGGSSKRMVVNQKVVDLSSTEVVGAKVGKESIRPVHSAILIDAES